MCSKTIPIASGVMKNWNGRALDMILVGPYGSQRYAGESASSILLYCSAPKTVSEISSPGSRFAVMSCWAPAGDQTPLKSRTHLALDAGEFGPAPSSAAAGDGTRIKMPNRLAAVSIETRKRLLIVNLLFRFNLIGIFFREYANSLHGSQYKRAGNGACYGASMPYRRLS